MFKSFAPGSILLSGLIAMSCYQEFTHAALVAPANNNKTMYAETKTASSNIRYSVNRSVIFGDSISDSGNLNALLRELSGGRLSDGVPTDQR